MTRKALSLGILIAAVALTMSMVLGAAALDNCVLKNGGFRATVSTSVYTGPPPIPFCLTGVPIVKVDVTIRGKGGATGSTSGLRCGALSEPVTVTVNGREHLVAPDSGYDWEDALTDCGALIYKVN